MNSVNEQAGKGMGTIVVKTMMVHTITYFICGIAAYGIFDYGPSLETSAIMRPASDPFVRAGVLFQPIRGALFGIVFFFLRDILLIRPRGWLSAWMIFVIVGILSPFGPAPGSIEGFVYLKEGVLINPGGILEVIIQSFLLSYITFYYVNHPEKKWINWVTGSLFIIILVLPVLGLLAG